MTTTPHSLHRPLRPRFRARGHATGWVLGGSLLTLWLPGQEPARTVPRPQEFVTTQEDSLFSLVRAQEDVHQWEQALADRDRGEHQSAAERLQRLLQTEVGGTVSIGPNRFVGLRHAVVLTLANLPAAGLAAYEELVRREAGGRYEADLTQLRTEQLVLLAERFPTAAIGLGARLRLGDLALECGKAIEASRHFDQALAATPIGSTSEPAVRERQACAETMLRASIRRGRDDLSATEATVLAALPVVQDARGWSGFGGGYDGNRPMSAPLGRPRSMWTDTIPAPVFDHDGLRNGNWAMQPCGDLDAVYLCTGLEVHAVDPLRGALLWTSPSPMREQVDQRRIYEDYHQSINRDMVLAAAAADDVVVAALQVPDAGSQVLYQNAFKIMDRIPERRLFAFERSTGRLLWSHFDRVDGPQGQRFRGHAVCGPPLILDDCVYAPVHDRTGAIAFYVGAYDLRTGQPRWRRLVCSSQQEVNMFGNARMEFASSPLCAAGGLLLGASNLGVCFAIEHGSGRMRWITAYDVIQMPASALQGQQARVVRFMNNAPVVADGVLCCTPLDSEHVLGLDIVTGEPLWRVPWEARVDGNNDVRWLCGALDDEFVLAGRGVVAVRARPAKAASAAALRLLRGETLQVRDRRDGPRPAVGDGVVYVPEDNGITVLDRDGHQLPGQSELRLQNPGNLLLVDGIVVSVSNELVEVLLDQDALRRRVEEQLATTPSDPAAIMRLCTLRAATAGDDRQETALEALYARGIAACAAQRLPKTHPLHAAFLRRLFDLAAARGEAIAGIAALPQLLAARDVAPDTAAFLRVQTSILQRSEPDRDRYRHELDVLLQRAGAESWAMPQAGGTIAVAAWVDWRRAVLAETPREQVAAFQLLLERHPEARIDGRSAAEIARQLIAGLVQQYGSEVYADVEARAAELLASGDRDAAALRAVGQIFPNSQAARTAAARLLDAAVATGDLATAVDVAAPALRENSESPALLRRLLEAARLRGNRGLARTVALRLCDVDATSDWAEDGGRTFAAVGRELLPALQPLPVAAQVSVPAHVVATLDSPSPPFGFRLLPVSASADFVSDGQPVLYVNFDDQLRAIDLGDPQRSLLFTHKCGIVDRLWLCGRMLIVPNLDRIAGIDARNGALQWEYSAGRMLSCHGVADGVLQLTRRDDDDDVAMLGLEPLTGRLLWTRPMPSAAQAPQPRPTAAGLLVLRAGTPPAVECREPLTGRTRASFVLGSELLAASGAPAEALQTGLLLQHLSANDELLFVPIDGNLSGGTPRVFALRRDGSIAWRYEGTPGRHLQLVALRADRLAIVEVSTPGGGNAVVLAADTGAPLRKLPIGSDALVLNWQRQRAAAPAPMALLVSDLDATTGDRRLVCLPVDDGLPAFAHTLGGNGDQVVRAPVLTQDLLVFAVESQRSQGPLRLFALRPQDRTSALPDGQAFVLLPTGPRSPHELAAVGPYTVLASDARLFVIGDGKDTR